MIFKMLKSFVSKKKKRYNKEGFNLDLSYIDDRIIAMGYPAENIERVWRNHIDDVSRFLDLKHKDHYWVYNLCSERRYDHTKFYQRVTQFPFDDHNPPPMHIIKKFCLAVDAWLAKDPSNVVAIHCKAGKGRTGVMICAYLMHSGHCSSPSHALAYFGEKRTYDSKGVTIPSQRRYVQYYGDLIARKAEYKPLHLNLALLRIEYLQLPSGCLPNVTIITYEQGQRALEEAPLAIGSDGQPLEAPAHPVKKELYRGVIGKLDVGMDNVYQLHFPCLPLQGDVKLEFWIINKLRKKERLFSCWFNTAFVHNSSQFALELLSSRNTHISSASSYSSSALSTCSSGCSLCTQPPPPTALQSRRNSDTALVSSSLLPQANQASNTANLSAEAAAPLSSASLDAPSSSSTQSQPVTHSVSVPLATVAQGEVPAESSTSSASVRSAALAAFGLPDMEIPSTTLKSRIESMHNLELQQNAEFHHQYHHPHSSHPHHHVTPTTYGKGSSSQLDQSLYDPSINRSPSPSVAASRATIASSSVLPVWTLPGDGESELNVQPVFVRPPPPSPPPFNAGNGSVSLRLNGFPRFTNGTHNPIGMGIGIGAAARTLRSSAFGSDFSSASSACTTASSSRLSTPVNTSRHRFNSGPAFDSSSGEKAEFVDTSEFSKDYIMKLRKGELDKAHKDKAQKFSSKLQVTLYFQRPERASSQSQLPPSPKHPRNPEKPQVSTGPNPPTAGLSSMNELQPHIFSMHVANPMHKHSPAETDEDLSGQMLGDQYKEDTESDTETEDTDEEQLINF